ncbi:MAG: hypothetical protein K6F98_05685 [Bacteroidales bacterium]|nr:hypothetical protein [Bacteroidales bacterium]
MTAAETRSAMQEWRRYLDNLTKATPVEHGLDAGEIARRRAALEADPEAWIRYFFPSYCKYPFADFHRRAIRRILSHPEWYEVLSWSRELAKSTVVMFCVMYLALTGRKRNVMLASATQDAAVRLLAPYRANFEANGRIKAFYGEQVNPGQWTDREFVTTGGVAFRAIGAGNAPRGSRNEAVRPDCILVDDFDTDEECRNPDIIQKKWEWYEQALYPTRSVSEPTTIIWCGNIIARDCCVVRAARRADHHDVVNIRDRQGRSTWPEKNTEQHIDETLKKISAASVQKEYYNNPVQENAVFRELVFGEVPPLGRFRFVVIYGDPAPGESRKTQASTKTVCLCGMLDGRLYVIKARLDRGTNQEFIQWYIDLLEEVGDRTTVYCYMENNSLQDPFFRQVFMPIARQKAAEQHVQLNIMPDTARKTDKATRIEANLEPLNSAGNLVFNRAEQDSPHMQRLRDQFQLFTLQLRYPADGPDCIEGALRIIRQKQRIIDPVVAIAGHKNNRHRL